MKLFSKLITFLVVTLVMGACKPTTDGGDNSGGSNTGTETPESVVYTVAFDGNGGEVKSFNEAGELVVVSSREVESGKTLSSLPLSLLDNYAFLGWHDSNGVEFTIDTVVTKDITLTATLEVATAGLAYVDNGDGTASVGNNQSFVGTDVVIASTYNGLPVTEIGKSAFKSTGLTSIIIPNSVTTIGNSAFQDCESLKKVIMSKNVTTIKDSTFLLCAALASIEISAQVEVIEEYAFQDTGLTSITIPDKVRTIGERAFEGCDAASFEINVEGKTAADKPAWDSSTSTGWHADWDLKESGVKHQVNWNQ